MHETDEDLSWLQGVIDRSHASAGEHLRSIWSDDKRIAAAELPELLTGVCVLSLATVTAAGEPRVAPVDGLFYRGRFWFGSSPVSARFRHLRSRPAVSAAHLRGETFAVVVHGRALPMGPGAGDAEPGFRAYLSEVYGDGHLDWAGDAPYAAIEPATMFTYWWRDFPGAES